MSQIVVITKRKRGLSEVEVDWNKYFNPQAMSQYKYFQQLVDFAQRSKFLKKTDRISQLTKLINTGINKKYLHWIAQAFCGWNLVNTNLLETDLTTQQLIKLIENSLHLIENINKNIFQVKSNTNEDQEKVYRAGQHIQFISILFDECIRRECGTIHDCVDMVLNDYHFIELIQSLIQVIMFTDVSVYFWCVMGMIGLCCRLYYFREVCNFRSISCPYFHGFKYLTI